MPCYHPLQGFRSRTRNASGKRSIVFSVKDGFIDRPVTVPCGQCIGCRLERSRQWAIRCVHESQTVASSAFITLTYDDAHLPASGSLVKRDFQLFIKRLRKRFPIRISYFHCGEYGDLTNRPHYHALIFGFDFPDRVLWRDVRNVRTYTSEILSSLWPFGFCTVGDVTFESAAYVARYVVKKVTGEAAEKHYERVVDETGEIVKVLPEYITMSLKPAIGRRFFEKFTSDIFPSDEVVLRGISMKPPKYYSGVYELLNAGEMEQIKFARIKDSLPFRADSSPDRLRVRERVKRAQISNLKRSVD